MSARERWSLFTLFFVLAAGPAMCANPQPTIRAAGVVNAASYLSGSIAPGEIITIFGTDMGPSAVALMKLENGSVTTSLADTQVLIGGVPAPLIYVWRNQIGAVVPYEVSGKISATVQVSNQGINSNEVTLAVAGSAPGLFTLRASGTGQAAALNQDNITINGADHPAPKGSIVSFFGTGDGQTSPAGVDGKLTTSPLPKPLLDVSMTIGGIPAEILYAGEAPGLVSGVVQVNARVPDGVTPGPEVPVVLTVGSASSQAGVTIAVRRSDPALVGLSGTAEMTGGATVNVTATLSAPAPDGGVVVSLQSNNPAVQVPASVTIPAGQTSASFSVTASNVGNAQDVTITATSDGVSRTFTFTLRPPGSASADLVSVNVSTTATSTGTAVNVTVTLSNPAPAGGLTVSLQSSNAAVQVPATVTIPAGQTSTSFVVNVANVSNPQTVTITATFNGMSRTFTFTLQPPGSASAEPVSVNVSTTATSTGTAVNITVTLSNPAPAGGLTVGLQSSNPAVQVPATVTIPAGQTSTSFVVNVANVSSPQTVTITATFNGVSRSFTFTLQPPPPPAVSADLASISATATLTSTGATIDITVTLSAPAPADGLTVGLQSSNPAVQVPASVTIPAGQSSATFVVTVAAVTTPQDVTITATFNATVRSATFRLRPGFPLL